MSWYLEGQAQFQVRQAFFRPQSRIVRDLGVLAAMVHRDRQGQLRVLDAMAGSGVRSLRYWVEAKADSLWVNDSDPDLESELRANLEGAIASQVAQVTCQDANRVFFDCYGRQDYYDFVDVDCFGSALPYLSTSLWAVAIHGLLYITSTDIRTVAGHPPGSSVVTYGAYARHHPAIHEQGLRIVLGTLHREAAQKGLGIQPLFSLFTGQTYRLMVRLLPKPTLSPSTYGFLGYCHRCGSYQSVDWRDLGRSHCSHDQHPHSVSGPLWLGALHHQDFLEAMRDRAQSQDWQKADTLLHLLSMEVSLPPFFYMLGEIGRRSGQDIPGRSRLIQALQDAGFSASPTHFNPQALKTNADLPTCVQIARHL